MFINFWDCKYSECENENISTEDDPDYVWVYCCSHPRNENFGCVLDNQWNDDRADCKFLDVEV